MSYQSHNELHTALKTTGTSDRGWSEHTEKTMEITELFRFINSSLLISHRPLNASPVEQTVYAGCAHMPSVLIFYLVLQFINMFLGIPANIMVLWLIRKNKGDSSTSDIFIIHLAVLDTFFCLSPPLELANIVYLTSSSTWFVLRFFYGLKDLSPLFLSCICLDRYMAVCHPITFTELKDQRHRSVCAGAVWLVTLVYASAKCAGNIPNFEKVFTVMILVAFAFMLFCNISILWALRRSAPGRDERHPVKKKAFRMVIIILAIIVFNYFPPVALFPFQEYFSPEVFRCYIHYIAFGFMDISSSIQPVLYLSRDKLHKVPPRCSKNTESVDDPVFTVSH
ncbi:proteinase-activated receptor 3 isoform X2 [Pimephales promelas]|uniref:proteinase-activated receptor 3 isoform X2 n=1 Tax=Pimephales promelas TaxID=90988 RepID=UPI001955D87B|nr:proteinase-activated receptor 3 isoform X2 [Pimephales promelas]KAG1957735.1 uracil nucleotide/cysteinyl leukotriene receptor [Pimephales promelas]